MKGSYARFEHYLTTLEVETCPELWSTTPVSGLLCGAASYKGHSSARQLGTVRHGPATRARPSLCHVVTRRTAAEGAGRETDPAPRRVVDLTGAHLLCKRGTLSMDSTLWVKATGYRAEFFDFISCTLI